MKKLCAVILCFTFLTLPACGQYLYGPTMIQRWTTEGGDILPNDKAVVNRADEINRAWEKRALVSGATGIFGDAAEAGSPIVSTIMTALGFIPGVGMIVSGALTLLGKLISTINTDDRKATYAEGGMRISSAMKVYLAARQSVAPGGETTVPNNKLTPEGLTLYERVNDAINDVQLSLAGRILQPAVR